jgi:hypothetical protein
MTESTRTTRSSNNSRQRNLAGPAILSAFSLTIPLVFFILAFVNPGAGAHTMGTAATIAVVAAVGAIYVFLVLRARESGPAIVAGVSTSLGVLGLFALVAALLLAKLDQMLGGSGSGAIVAVVLAYVAVQFVVARVARGLAGTSRLRTNGAFQLGLVVPVLFAIGVSATRSIPRRAALRQFVADSEAREATRADLFALYACATAHRALDPRHDYPPTLKALGPEGDKCLPEAVANGERHGWTFAYSARPSTADSAAAFTVRATPLRATETATTLTIDERGLVLDDWLNATRAPLFRPDPPGLDMLIAIGGCERAFRETHGGTVADLKTLRAIVDSSWKTRDSRCDKLENLNGRVEWFEYGRPRVANEWKGKAYRITFHPRYGADSSVAAWEARPVTFGTTGVWSYLALSSGTMYGTTEPRAATTGDAVIPRCEFGAPPAGSGQCVPGSSAPPNATLVVDSVVDASGFTVSLVNASGDTPATTAAGFQYTFSCDGLENNNFVKDSTRTCRAPWSADSLQVTARIRNRDLAVSEYTRKVRVRQPRLATTLATPKPVVLGDVLELDARDLGRNPNEQIEYTIRVGDAPAETRMFPAKRALFHCRATTSQQSFDCSYPAKPGKYEVRLTAQSRNGDSSTAVGEATVNAPELLRLRPTSGGTVRVGGAGEYLELELLVDWPAEHGQTRLVRDAVGAGDIGPEPPKIGSVEGVYAERAERASDGRTVVPVGFRWSELVASGAVVPGLTREVVVVGRRGHVHDFVPYRQRVTVRVEK